jgi:hypothetical protein
MMDSSPPTSPGLPGFDLHSPQRQLIEWQMAHADLDALIDQASAVAANQDDLSLRRMKKRRLALRDQIALLQARLQPKEPA